MAAKGKRKAALLLAVGLAPDVYQAFGRAARTEEEPNEEMRRLMLESLRNPALRELARLYCLALAHDRYGAREEG